MMAVLKDLKIEMYFQNNHFQTLIIENNNLFRQILFSFENDLADDIFTFSKNYIPFEFSKRGVYLSNIINLDMNNKKLLTKMIAQLENTVNDEYCEEFNNLKSEIIKFADTLVKKSDFDIDYNYDIDFKSLTKLLDIKLSNRESSFAENFIRYICLFNQYLGVSFFVVFGLHIIFDKNELNSIFETLKLNDINLLCIEGYTYLDNISSYEKVYIIDGDLCVIM